MLSPNSIRIIFLDFHRSRWKLLLCLGLIIFGIIVMAETYGFPPANTSIPDVFAKLFLKESIYLLMVPVYLFILSFTLPALFEPLRMCRYRSRGHIVGSIVVNVVFTLTVFLSVYFLVAFIYGWIVTGTISNSWKTEEGIPYIVYKGDIDLSLFSNHFIFFRYTMSQFFSFLFLGLSAALLYVLLKRFIYVFFILIGYILLERGLHSFIGINLFLNKAEVMLGTWGDSSYLMNIVIYFIGLSFILLFAIYIVIMKKDFIVDDEGEGL